MEKKLNGMKGKGMEWKGMEWNGIEWKEWNGIWSWPKKIKLESIGQDNFGKEKSQYFTEKSKVALLRSKFDDS